MWSQSNFSVNSETSNVLFKGSSSSFKKPCSYCGQYFSSSMKVHMRTHTGEKPFQCHHCPYRAAYKSNFKKHLLIHKGEKPHQCPYCDYKATQRTHLVTDGSEGLPSLASPLHASGHIRLEEWRHKIYSNSFILTEPNSPSAIKKQCYYCGLWFLPSNIKMHIRTHTGEKPFQCMFCPYRSAQNANLKKHVKLRHLDKKDPVVSGSNSN